MRAELGRRGYTIDETTRAMGRSLDDLSLPSPAVELGPPDWAEHLRIIGAPGLLADADPRAFHILVAQLSGENVATAIALDHDRDCGLFNVVTLAAARRRGLGMALTALHLLEAVRRGCSTASLQSTPMAEGIYAAVGFRDLGRILEYVPSVPPRT
jgi:ribosomal protein S18 acetylase RimI-like enzyme